MRRREQRGHRGDYKQGERKRQPVVSERERELSVARAHEVSPRAILRYKSKATSFGCNTRSSIDARPGVLSNREPAVTDHRAIVSRITHDNFFVLVVPNSGGGSFFPYFVLPSFFFF